MRRTAALLRPATAAGKALPRLLFFTDPGRTPDPVAIAWTLPRGAAIVFRGFGAPDAEATASALAGVARARGLILLIGADAALALRVGADGVHLPERDAPRAGRLRRRHRRWIVTSAAHSLAAARRGLRLGADAVVVSAIFPSASASAGTPMGCVRLARLVRLAGGPVYALGGVNDRTAARLAPTGVVGVAAIDGFRT